MSVQGGKRGDVVMEMLMFTRRAAVVAVLLTIPLSGSGTGHAPAAQTAAAAPAEVRTW